MMSAEEFAALKADIKANGLLEPIWTYRGGIIDGRNRFNACREVGVEPRFREWTGNGSLVSFVVSLNLRRRHLTVGQQACVAEEALPHYEAEARERQRGGQGGVLLPSILTEAKGEARGKVAKDFGVSQGYISEARRLKHDAPDLHTQVRAGKINIPSATRELKRRERAAEKPPPLPTDKYRILYADPPWEYSDSGVINDDNYGRAERHYATMPIDELCEMGDAVKEITEENAVLFLWATSPMLEDAFKIIRAWGFKYKTSFVWDKVKHNFGHYNSVRHEFLLVCTKGSCIPDTDKKYDSVVSIERTPKHSEKPEEFREIIDALYKNGKRIELFARSQHKDWEVWGNQV